MLRLTIKHVGLLLHIFAIFHVDAQYNQPRGYPPWSPMPRPVYQVKHVDPTKNFYRVFGDRFEIPLSHLKNIYLAGYDTEIYQLKKDVEAESVKSEIKVTFYLWTHHGFRFIGKLNTDLQTLKRNINKYHHYFQLKKVYIERYTKKKWRIDKLIMLPSKFSDDVVLRKYHGNENKDLMAVVEEPTVATLPEPCEEVKQDTIQASQPKPEVNQSDVLIDIYKELTDTKAKLKNNKEDIKGTNDVCKSNTATCNYNSEKATTNPIQELLAPLVNKPEKSETNMSSKKYQTTVTPGILTEYNSQIGQNSQQDTSVQFVPTTAENIPSVNYNFITPGVLTEYDAKLYQNNQEPINFDIKAHTDNVKFTNHGLKVTTPGLFNKYDDISMTVRNNIPQIIKQSQINYVTYRCPGEKMFWPRGAAGYSQINKNNQKGSSVYFGPNIQTANREYSNYGLGNLTPNIFNENKVPQVAESQMTRDNTKPQINISTYASPNNQILDQYHFTNRQQNKDKISTGGTKIYLNDAEYYKNDIHKSDLGEKSTQMNYIINPGPGNYVFQKDTFQYNIVDHKHKDNETPTETLYTHKNKIRYDHVKSGESNKYNQDYTPTQIEENIMETAQTYTSPGFVTNIAGFVQYGIAEKINNDKLPIELKETQSVNVAHYDRPIDQKQKQDRTSFKDIKTQINTLVCNKRVNEDALQFPKHQKTLDKIKPQTDHVTYTTVNSNVLSSGLNQYHNTNRQQNIKFGMEQEPNKVNPKVVKVNYVTQTSLAPKMIGPYFRQYFYNVQTEDKNKVPFESIQKQFSNMGYTNNDFRNIPSEVNYDFEAPGIESKINIWEKYIKGLSTPHTNLITFTAPSINKIKPGSCQYCLESPIQKTDDIYVKTTQEPNYSDDIKFVNSGPKNKFYIREQSDKESVEPCMNRVTYYFPSTAIFESDSKYYLNGQKSNEDKISTLDPPLDANLYNNFDFKIVSSQPNYLTRIDQDTASRNKVKNPQTQCVVTEYSNQLYQGQMPKTNYHINENTAKIQLNNDCVSKQEPEKYSEFDSLYYQTYPQQKHNEAKPMQFAKTKYYDVKTPSICKFNHIYPQNGYPRIEFNNNWSAKIERIKPKPRIYKIGFGNIQQTVPDIITTKPKSHNTYRILLNKPDQPNICQGIPLYNMKSYSNIQNTKRPNIFESQIKDMPLLYSAEKQKNNKKFINPATISNYSTGKSKSLIGNSNVGHIASPDDNTIGKAIDTGTFENTKTEDSNKIPCYTSPQTYSISGWNHASPIKLPENKEKIVSYIDSEQVNSAQIDNKINNVQNVYPVENLDYSAATSYEARNSINPNINEHDLFNYFSYAQDNKQNPYILSQIDKLDNTKITSPDINIVDNSLGTYNKKENTIYPEIHNHNEMIYTKNYMVDKKLNMEIFPINTHKRNHYDSDYVCNTKAISKPCDISSFNIQTKMVKDEPQTIPEELINKVEKPTSSTYDAFNSWIDLGKQTAVAVNKNKVSFSKPNTFNSLPKEDIVPCDNLIKEDTAKVTNTKQINLNRPTTSGYTNYIQYPQPLVVDFYRQKSITDHESRNDKSFAENPEYSNLATHSGEAYLRYYSCNNNEKYVTDVKENNPTIKKVLQTDTIKYLESKNTKEFNSLPEYIQSPQKFLNIYDSSPNYICYPKTASGNLFANVETGECKSRKLSPYQKLITINNGPSKNVRLEERKTLNPSFIHQSKYKYNYIPAASLENQPVGASIQSFLPHSFSIPGTLHHFYSHFASPNKYEPRPTRIENNIESSTYNKDPLSPKISPETIQLSNSRTNDGLSVNSNGVNKENIIQYDTNNLGAIYNSKPSFLTHLTNSGSEINNLYNKPSYDNVIPLSIASNADSYDFIQDNVATNSDIKWDQFNTATFSQYKPSITIEENDKVFYNTVSQNSMPLNSEPCNQYQPSLTTRDQYYKSFSDTVPIPPAINEKINICAPVSTLKRKTDSQNVIDEKLSIFTDYSGPFVFTNPNKMSTEHHMLPNVIKSTKIVQPISYPKENSVSSNSLLSAYPSDVSYSDSKPQISSPAYSTYKVNKYPRDSLSLLKKDFHKILKPTPPITSWYSPELPFSPNLPHSKSSSYSQPSYLFAKPTLLVSNNHLNICPYKPTFYSQPPITEKTTTPNENLPHHTYSHAGSSTFSQPSYYTEAYSSVPTPSFNNNNGAFQLFESDVNPKSSIVVENSNQNKKRPDPCYSYDKASVYSQSSYISPKISSTSIPCQTLTPMSKTYESFDENIVLEPLANDIKTSVNNWLRTDQISKKLTIPVGQISLARLPDINKSYILKTDDPNIRIRAWKDKIKIVKVKLVLETQECSVMNFLPEIVKGDYDADEVQNIVKNYVKRNYGEPIVIKGNSFYKPYVVVYNSEMIKSGRCSILWPPYNSQLHCWTS